MVVTRVRVRRLVTRIALLMFVLSLLLLVYAAGPPARATREVSVTPAIVVNPVR